MGRGLYGFSGNCISFYENDLGFSFSISPRFSNIIGSVIAKLWLVNSQLAVFNFERKYNNLIVNHVFFYKVVFKTAGIL